VQYRRAMARQPTSATAASASIMRAVAGRTSVGGVWLGSRPSPSTAARGVCRSGLTTHDATPRANPRCQQQVSDHVAAVVAALPPRRPRQQPVTRQSTNTAAQRPQTRNATKRMRACWGGWPVSSPQRAFHPTSNATSARHPLAEGVSTAQRGYGRLKRAAGRPWRARHRPPPGRVSHAPARDTNDVIHSVLGRGL